MVVSPLRQFAERTARENWANLPLAHPKLRTINTLARELLNGITVTCFLAVLS
jgi:hypothetical protein